MLGVFPELRRGTLTLLSGVWRPIVMREDNHDIRETAAASAGRSCGLLADTGDRDGRAAAAAAHVRCVATAADGLAVGR